jgi:hypothetical protein
MRLVQSIIAAASLAAIASQALAHTPRMNSSAFWAEHDVSAETACSTDIFTPVVGIPAEGLAIISPSGERLGLARIEVAPDVTRLEAILAREGAYRLTTGEQHREVAPMVPDRGRWRLVQPGERLARRARGEGEDDMRRVFVTDEHGRAHLSFDEPGLYLAVVRFRCPAPAGTRSRDEPPGRFPIGQRGKRENA